MAPTYRAVCVEVDGAKELQLTRMGVSHLRRGGGEYFSVDDYQLRDGLRAAVGEQEYGGVRWSNEGNANTFRTVGSKAQRRSAK